MAKNPEIQNELRKNINQTLSTTDGKLSYDTLKDMKYLDMVIKGKFSIFIINTEFNMTREMPGT